MNLTHRFADALGGLEHVVYGKEASADVRRFKLLTQNTRRRLRDGQVAGGLQHEDAVAGPLEHGRLAKRIDLIDAGAGAGIGKKDKPGVEQNAHAIGHGRGIPLRREAGMRPLATGR